MFLHSDAGLHGHEYSNRRRSAPPLSHKTPLSNLPPYSPIDPKQAFRATELGGNRQDPIDTLSPRLSLPNPSAHRRSRSDLVYKGDAAVKFREPKVHSILSVGSARPSGDGESLAGSELSDSSRMSSTRRRRSKQFSRESTRFAVAHPAPQFLSKQRRLMHIRPRLMLQLQQLGDKRAIPAYDVVPSSVVAGHYIIPHLRKHLPWALRAKSHLGQDDLLILRSEDYGIRNSSAGSEVSLRHRDVLGVISPSCQPGDGNAEVVLGDGSIWQTTSMVDGSYEFTSMREDGSTAVARWVRRRITALSASQVADAAVNHMVEYKWTFSLIDPSSKRHPILGVLTSTMLEMFDTYTTLSASSRRFPPRTFESVTSGDADVDRSFGADHIGRRSETVPEEHKNLMLATAAWVCLRLDSCPALSTEKQVRGRSHCRSATGEHSEASQTISMSRKTTPSPGVSFPDSQCSSARNSGDVNRGRVTSTGATYMAKRRMALAEETDSAAATKHGIRVRQKSHYNQENRNNKKSERDCICRGRLRSWKHKLFSHE